MSLLAGLQSILDEIVAKRSDLSEKQILQLIDEKKKQGRGLLSDEGAARLVAEELLVQTGGTELGRMQVKDLVSGLNDVTISGRVLLAWPPQQFQRRDGTAGRVMRIVLVDRSGRTRCALWDRHVDVAIRSGALQGRILRIGHAYTRQGLAGDAEVHAGDRSSIEIDPQDLPQTEFPEFKELFTQLGDLRSQENFVNVTGIIQSEPKLYTFSRDDRPGNLVRSVLADESGSIPLVVWNERVEELGVLKTGDILQIMNCRTKMNNNGRLELHVESRSQVTKLANPPEYLRPPSHHTCKISDISNRMASVDLSVCVLSKGSVQEIKRPTGETSRMSTLMVSDESGIISVSLWDDKVDASNNVKVGDCLQLRNVNIAERSGNIRLSLGKSGELETSEAGSVQGPLATRLDGLSSAKSLLIVQGIVADAPTVRQVATEKESNINVASFTLRDDTGSVRVTFWREQAKLVSDLKIGEQIKLIGVRVQSGLGGQLELSSIQLTRMHRIEYAGEPVKA